MTKNKYSLFLLLILLPLLVPFNTQAVVTNENVLSKVEQITLKEISKHAYPSEYVGIDNGKIYNYSLQGGAITDKYIVSCFLYNPNQETGPNAMFILDKNNFQRTKNITNNPIIKHYFRHCNDMTYNSKTNEIVVVNKGYRILNADTFEIKKEVELSGKFPYSIAYDKNSNHYFVAVDNKISILDEKFNELSSFTHYGGLIRQNLASHNSLIYMSFYEDGSKKVLNKLENAVIITDQKGNYKKTFFISDDYGELEWIDFKGNKMILAFNNLERTGSSYYTIKYDDITVPISAKLQDINMQITDGLFEISLYKDGKLIETVKNKNKDFLFSSLTFQDEGTYNYTIKQTKMDLENISYDDRVVNVSIKITYDPFENKLNSIITYHNNKELVIKNTIKSNINTLKSLDIGLKNFKYDPDKLNYELEVGSGIDKITINSTLTDSKAKYVKNYGNRTVKLNKGINNILIKVQAENGEVITYSIVINKIYNNISNDNNNDNNENDATLKLIKIESVNFDFSSDIYEYEIIVPNGIKDLKFKAIPNNEFSVVTYKKNIDSNTGKNTIVINVESPSGESKEYKITVLRGNDNNSAYIYLVALIIFLVLISLILMIIYKRKNREYKHL